MPHSNSIILELKDISRSFERDIILKELSLQLFSGEFLSILGPSGVGKSTLLQLIAGLQKPESGVITSNCKRIAYVFQTPNLLPWKTVLQNVLFSTESRFPKQNKDQEAIELLTQMGLEEALHQYPKELSEGMKQRVNLARSLLIEPDLLLMDEPFSALDVQTRAQLHTLLLEQWKRVQCTILLISHDIEEVVKLCDRIAFLISKPAKIEHITTVDLPRPRDNPESLQKRTQTIQKLFHEKLYSVPRSRKGGA